MSGKPTAETVQAAISEILERDRAFGRVIQREISFCSQAALLGDGRIALRFYDADGPAQIHPTNLIAQFKLTRQQLDGFVKNLIDAQDWLDHRPKP